MVRLSRVYQTLGQIFSQIFMRSSDFRAFVFRLSNLHVQNFLRSSLGFCALLFRLASVHVQAFVHSCSDFRAFMFRFPCVHQTFVLSCSHFHTFFDVSTLCNFERTTSPWALVVGVDILASGPQLGTLTNYASRSISKMILSCCAEFRISGIVIPIINFYYIKIFHLNF